MKTFYFIPFSIAFGLILIAFNITNKPIKKTMTPLDKGDKYKKEWQKVDSLVNLGQTKSALDIVEEIYKKAKTDKNSDQILKAFTYRLKFKNILEENAYENLIKELESEAKVAEFPNNAVMHSMLAEMYWMFYENNRWKFQNRTNTVDFKQDDIQTWTLDQLTDKVIKEYYLSLANKDMLQQTPVNYYDEIIIWGTFQKDLRPTLYDFLANRAINFFSNPEISLSRPADYFDIKEEFYFSEAKDFVNLKINTGDTLSIHYNGVKILQELLSFRLSKTDEKNALIDADLTRLNYINRFSVNILKDSLYLKQLQKLEEKYKDAGYYPEILYQIALYYYTKSSNYSAEKPETEKYKNYKKAAYDITVKVITDFKDTYAAEKCKSIKIYCETKNLTGTTENVLIPGQKSATKITYTNIDRVHIRVASFSRDRLEKLQDDFYGTELYDKIFAEAKTIYTDSKALIRDDDMNQHSTEILINPLNVGFYVIFFSNNEKFTYDRNLTAYEFVEVSNMSYIKQVVKDGSYNFTVANRKTGEPMQGVSAQTYYERYDQLARRYRRVKGDKFVTDVNGAFTIKSVKNNDSRTLFVEFTKDNDFLSSDDNFYMYYTYPEKRKNFNTILFTDRAIYRPGQTVYFKGVLVNTDGENSEIAVKQNLEVVFYDVNYQKINSLQVTTNEYGTFNGTFEIPMGLLNGVMQVYTAYGAKQIQVEEYKRPTFEVEILPFTGNYQLNDKISVQGKATNYSGALLTDASVKYRVIRQPVWRGWWYYNFNNQKIEITNGTTVTNENGEFKIDFQAIPDLSMPKSEYLSFSYQIIADVTDLNGETQSKTKSIVVGYRALVLDLSLNEQFVKEETDPDALKIKIVTQNLNGEFIKAKGKIKIQKLELPSDALRNRNWTAPDKFIYSKEEWDKEFPGNEFKAFDITKQKVISTINEIEFDTEKEKNLDISFLKKQETGLYCAEIESVDAFGNPVLFKKFFTIVSQTDKKMPYKTIDWFNEIKTDGEPGEKASFLIGSSRNVKVLYEIEHKDDIIKKEWISVNNEQKIVEIPIEEKYRGNFSVHFTFINENRIYSHTSVVTVPYTNKMLDIEFSTFRDKLYPGQSEEWKLLIKGKNGEKVMAEMVASLYDASLDQFKPNYWNFDIYRSYYSSIYWSTGTFNNVSTQLLKEGLDSYYYPVTKNYDLLNWFGFSYYSYNNYFIMADEEKSMAVSNSRTMKKNGAKPSKAKEKADGDEREEVLNELPSVTQTEMDLDGTTNVPPPPPAPGEVKQDLGDVKVRTNFNETAFFYPQLETNENGEIIVKFTVPESLTKWKMMGFAHTKDLKYGLAQNYLVTQKDLMLMPNAPRFFRENDLIEFPVKINNISDKDLAGKIQLEFFDAVTLKSLDNVLDKDEKPVKDFEVKSAKNTLVSWKLKIPEGVGAISYKVVAKSGDFSDGEQKPLPVLTNRMLVTESLPLPIRSKQTKTFSFTKLINSGKSTTLRNEKLTLEFTSNPAWYAIQALPYIMEYPYECNEQTFSRFYANSIASHIANSTPKIKAVFDSWKNTPESKALLSNLEKNQELKAVLLEETPWVLNSQDESERKKRVGLLFDLNRMGDEFNKAIKKLEKEQYLNGGWPWFSGMPESRYITQHIVTGFGHLDKLGIKAVREDARVWGMVKKAVSYLDDRIADDFKELKRYSPNYLKEDNLSSLVIHYMYGRSYFTDLEIPGRTKEAFDYYKSQMEKYWLSRGIYEKGMIALALNRFKTEKIPGLIIKSLKENSIEHEELGMYWKENVSGYYWYQAPIETQAMMIEAFDEVGKDQASVESLKVWLLKQKQTQDWKTTKATVEAVYALLLRGTAWLASDEMVKIKVGDMEIDPKKMDNVKVEAGTGYFKTSWSKGEITPNMGNITVSKTDEGVSWGAMYWQYFEQLDKITPAATPLKLDKKLFKEVLTDRGRVIEPITDKTQLLVGDKIIVRIELRVDRDMEYIHMKDARASGFEPINVISRYKYQDGLGYYESTKDAATNFFIGYLPKGTYVFEYPLRATHKGNFSNGITQIQCMYAPEFTSHSEGIRVKID